MSLLEKASLIVTPNAYKESILYSVVPNTNLGDMTVVRATTATRVNSEGLIESVGVNVPRIDYTNGSCPSLLVEPQRTNLFNYSEQFNNSSWDKIRATITSNTTIAPDGILSADSFTCTTTGSDGTLLRQVTVLTTERTTSIFVKPNTANYFQIHKDYGSGVVFDLTNGTIKQSLGATGTIIPLVNGWYKCTATFSVSGLSIFIAGNSSMTVANWSSTINQSLYIWGAQLEAGSYATSYIPTVATSATRNADVISKTGISSLIGQTEGTLFLDLKSVENGNISLSDNSDANNIIITFSKSYLSCNFYIYANNSDIIGTGYVDLPSEPMKLVFKYKSGEIKLFVNGVLAYTNTATFAFSNNLSFFGNRLYWGGGLFDGSINSEQLYKTALTDAECINLTTL